MDLLRKSILSLIETAHRSSWLEILVKVYDGDLGSIKVVEDIARLRPEVRFGIFSFPKRRGYFDINLFYNYLAGKASGDWLMIWEDAFEMVEKEWDWGIATMLPCRTWPGIAETCALVHEHGVKAVRRQLFHVLGSFSPHWLWDEWLFHVVQMAGVTSYFTFKAIHHATSENKLAFVARESHKYSLGKIKDVQKIVEYLKGRNVWQDTPEIPGWYVIRLNCEEEVYDGMYVPLFVDENLAGATHFHFSRLPLDHSVVWHLVNPG